jgi:hypothetical protein
MAAALGNRASNTTGLLLTGRVRVVTLAGRS